MDYKITSRDQEDTLEIAQNIESEKFPGMVICLNGELGSGKTVFVKGFASAEYNNGELPLFHMDAYRLDDDVESIGLNDYFNSDGILIIEWADMIEKYLPNERLDIYFKVVDENTRLLVFKPHGAKYVELCDAVL